MFLILLCYVKNSHGKYQLRCSFTSWLVCFSFYARQHIVAIVILPVHHVVTSQYQTKPR